MKNLYYTWKFTLLVAFISLHATFVFAGKGTADNDSIHTIKYIESISITDPHRALQVIDEAEELGRLPQYSLDQLRGIVYQNGLSMSRTSLVYTLRAYRNDSLHRHPDEVLLTLRLLTYQYNNTGNYTESTRYAFEGIELARQKGDKESEARFRLNVAINKRDMGLKKEAEPYLAESARLMEQAVEKKQSARKVDGLIYIYGMIATFAYEDGEYQKAIDLLPRYLRVMELFKSRADNIKGRYEMRLATIYIMYASIFAANGQMEEAEEYYRKFDAMEYAHTQDGNQMRFEYLVTTRRYREALRFIHADNEYYHAQGDTINYFYVDRNLHFEAKAYMGLGDYKNAAQTYKRMYDLADSLRVREKQNGVLEFAAIYETKEKEAELVKQSTRLRESRMIILFVFCLAVLLGVLLWRTVRHMRIIKEKNIAMVRTIRQQLGYKDQLYQREEEVRALREDLRQKTEGLDRLGEAMQEKEASLREMQEQASKVQLFEAQSSETQPSQTQASQMQPSEVQPKKTQLEETQPEETAVTENHPATEYTDAVMRELFARVEHEIISGKLYLNPDFSKEELLKIVHIPKNRFAGLFKDYAGATFLQYITKLRMEEAARMLSECPNYTIESVAQACGITNVRTFYRLFFDTFKMTPNDFRAVK